MIDSDTISILSGKFIVGTLIFIRVLGLFASGPFFSNTNIIPPVKIGLAAILAIMMTSAFWTEQPVIDFHLWNLAMLAIKEFFTGVALGFGASIVMHAARFAGGIIDFDMGYQAATLFDMESQSPTLIGEVKYLAVLMLFFAIDGHHYVIQALFASIRAVPLTTFAVTESTLKLMIRLSTSVLLIGVKMAAPVIASLFLANLALALMARVAPQTNIFMLSFQVKIAVGLLVLLVSVPLFVMVAKFALQSLESDLMRVLLSLNPARV
ncbi:MAG: flagellar biosynthesis protein FliR [Bacteroidota bacterium]|nr:flagellar biosynthesis protein FliR [Bacteroidota bacterium]